MNYLTGCGGFIGSSLARRAKPSFCIPHEAIYGMKFDDFDTFFFLSGYGNHSNQNDLSKTLHANVTQLEHVLKETSKLNFRNFIHVSTSSVTLKNQTPYSQAKAWGEELINWYANRTGKAYFSVRPYSIFGEGEADFRLIPTICRKLFNNEIVDLVPEPTHDWVYLDDFIEAIMLLADKVTEHIEPQGIGYGYPTTNSQVFRDIKKILKLPRKVTYNKIDNIRSYDSSSWYKKRSDYLDTIWEPTYGYWQGLKRTIAYYKELYAEQES